MKLKKFRRNENVKKVLILGLLCLIVVSISAGFTFAVYQQETEVQFINAKVGKFVQKDIELAIKVDEEEVEIPPSKDNYTVEVKCDNATGEWDKNKWAAVIGNINANKVKCEVNFITPEPTLTNVTATAEKTSIALSYTAGGIRVSTICKYGIDTNYGSTVSNPTNTNCNITGLDMDTTYYYQVCAINGGGEVCKDGSVKTKKQVDVVGDMEIGDYISMTPTSTRYIISKDLTGYTSNQTINPSKLNLWRVIRKNDDGTIEIVSEYISDEILTVGTECDASSGYCDGGQGVNGIGMIGVLNTIAAQYTNKNYIQSTRSMGETAFPSNSGEDYQNVKSALGSAIGRTKNGVVGSYWYSGGTREGEATETTWIQELFSLINEEGELKSNLIYERRVGYYPIHHRLELRVRPILTIKSSVKIVSGDGQSSDTAYQLS